MMSDKENVKKKYTTVSIPTTLFNKIKDRIIDTGFTSVSSYVTYVLREIISEDIEEEKDPFTTEDEERVKQRLRALGYLE